MKIRNNIHNFIKKLFHAGFVHIFSASVINKVISFAGSIVLVRVLTKREYGTYSYAYNILSFFLLMTGFGSNSGMLQMCCEEEKKEARMRIFSYGCRVGLGFNFFLGLTILGCAVLIPFPIPGANTCLMMMSFLPLFQIYPDYQHTYLRAERQNKFFAYSNTFQAGITFFCVTMLSYFLHVKGLILAYYLTALLSSFYTTVKLRVPLPGRDVDLASDVKKAFWGISGISMLNIGISHLMYLLDVFVLGIVVGDTDMIASYKVATTIPTALSFIPSAVAVFIYPMFVAHRKDKKWLLKNFSLVSAGLGGLNLLISAALFLFAPLILSILFGSQYLDAVIPFRILSVSYFFSGTFRIIAGNLLVTQRKLKFNLFESIASSGLNTVLNFYMISAWGSVGAATATFLTMFFSALLSTGYLLYAFCKAKNPVT